MRTLSKEPIECIYVEDNSPDTKLKELFEPYRNVNYAHIDNRGYGHAHNKAIRRAIDEGSDFHLVINPDVRWDGVILERLIDEMNKHDNCALLQPRIIYPDGRLQHTCRLLPTPLDVFAKRFLPAFLFKKRLKRYLLPESAYAKSFNAVYMQGSFMLFRTSCFSEIGLFDERFFMYPEDIDITRRTRSFFSAIYYPDISIVHDHQAASSRNLKMLWVHIVNMIKYFNKWGWFFDKNRRTLNKQLLKDIL